MSGTQALKGEQSHLRTLFSLCPPLHPSISLSLSLSLSLAVSLTAGAPIFGPTESAGELAVCGAPSSQLSLTFAEGLLTHSHLSRRASGGQGMASGRAS